MKTQNTFRGYLVKNGISTESGWGTGFFASELNEKQQMSIKGSITSMDKKTLYEITGEFEEHPRYGKTFRVDQYRKAPIHSKLEQIGFLSGPGFPGVGKKTAQLIVDFLDDNAIKQLVENPDILNQIPNLAKAYVPIIRQGIKNNIKQEGQERLRYIFFENNLKTSILDWMENYFDKDNEKIEAVFNERFLAFARKKEIASFEELDKVAVWFGLDQYAFERIGFWAWKIATDILFNSGNTYTDKNILSRLLMQKLHVYDHELIMQGLLFAKKEAILVLKENRIYTQESWDEEQIIAAHLIKYNQPGKKITHDKLDFEIGLIEQEIGFENNFADFKFDSVQKQALKDFATHRLLILTGGPGTGKTTLIKGMVKMFARLENSNNYAIATPTGRAAARIRETFKGSNATTIHKLLQAKELNQFQINAENPLREHLVILDECSMIDNRLFAQFIQSCDFVKKIILVGDANQLPSVGYGNVFADLIESKLLNTVQLATVHRQKDNSGIIDLAYQTLAKKLELNDLVILPNVEFYFDKSPSEVHQKIIELVRSQWSELQQKQNHLQIICPMYGGNLGIDEINVQIQNEFNQNIHDKKKIYQRGDYRFIVDDKIMFLKNEPDLDLANGDVGKIIEINYNSINKLKDVLTEFNDKQIILQPNNFNDVKLSYATSVHKTQGSEYNHVILVIDESRFNTTFLNNTLIYTAVTRAKNKIHLIGQSQTFFNAIQQSPNKRKTTLINKLIKLKEGQ